jgi:hypothetical protein
MKYLLLILFTFFITPVLFAQLATFLSDTNIVWAAEFTSAYHVDDLRKLDTKLSANLNRASIVKIFNPNDDFIDENMPLSSKILFHSQIEPTISVFKDLDCLIPTSVLEESGCLFRKIDPITKEKKIILSTCCETYIQSGDFKASQVLMYNKKSHKFQLLTKGICVLMDTTEKQSTSISYIEYFWFKPQDDYKADYNMNDSNINVIKRMRTPGNVLKFEQTTLILKNTIGNLGHYIMNYLKENPQYPLFNFDMKPLKKEDVATLRKPLFTKTLRDSFLSKMIADSLKSLQNGEMFFDQNSFPSFRNNEDAYKNWYEMPRLFGLDSNEIDGLRIVQDWYWDEKDKNMKVRLIAVSLLEKIYDLRGASFYSQSVFYMKN